MKNLIKLTQQTLNNEVVKTVNARDLHEFLEVNTRFNDWITKRIKDYNFIENQDFLTFTENSVKGQTGRPSRGYHISLDMAKELAMVERNEKGREARQYFIECEKEYKKTLENYIPKTLPDALEAYALELRKHEETKLLLKEALPKVDFYDTVTASEKLIDIGDTSKVLLFKSLGRNNLFKVLG